MSNQSANGKDKWNVVDLKNARKLGSNKNGGKKRSGANAGKDGDVGYARALKAQRGGKMSSFGSVQWFHYVQVIALLLLVGWLMRSCHS